MRREEEEGRLPGASTWERHREEETEQWEDGARTGGRDSFLQLRWS